MADDHPDDAEPDGDQFVAPAREREPRPRPGSTDETEDDGRIEGSVPDVDLDDSIEDRTASFVELEAELRAAVSEDVDRARVVGAETVPRDAVPEDYPWSPTGETVLALELDLGDAGTAPAYFSWPPEAGDPLYRLLDAADLDPEAFANLNGRQVLVEHEAEYVRPVVPEDSAIEGTDRGIYGILAGHAATLALVGGALAGLVDLPLLVVGLVIVHLLVLPVATYLDGWHLRTTTDWNQGPSFWATLQTVPILNVLVTLWYLRGRREARPLARS